MKTGQITKKGKRGKRLFKFIVCGSIWGWVGKMLGGGECNGHTHPILKICSGGKMYISFENGHPIFVFLGSKD